MKQEEKSYKSRCRILQASLKEFGAKKFEKASVTTICDNNNLSKGLVYHYFGSKDEIFLACVDECFDKLSKHLSQNVTIYKNDNNKTIEEYFFVRYVFFNSNPDLKGVFYNAMFQAPEHLDDKIKELHKKLDDINNRIVMKVLGTLKLRAGINIKDAEEYLTAFDEFYYSYFKKKFLSDTQSDEVVDLHDSYGHKALDFLLYGIAGQK